MSILTTEEFDEVTRKINEDEPIHDMVLLGKYISMCGLPSLPKVETSECSDFKPEYSLEELRNSQMKRFNGRSL